MLTLTSRAKAAAVAACMAAAAYGGWWLRDLYAEADESRWQLRWAEQEGRLAKAEADASEAARNEESRRQAAVNEAIDNARTEIERARADADRASAAADSLRKQAQRLAASAGKACGNPATAAGGKAAASAGLVLADVLGRADERAGELAAAYDRARIAGLACQQAYEGLTESQQ